MTDPQITVIITSYNQREFLVEAIESVNAQTLRPREILIADDASTDGSAEVIRDYGKRHAGWIRPLLQRENLGVARNRNLALSKAEGDFVTLLDGDDRFLPRKLEQEYATRLARPGARVVFSNIYDLDRTGRRIRLWADGESPPQGSVFPQVLARQYPHGTTFRNELVDIDCIRKVGGYDETLPRYGDWDLLIRLAERYEVAYCPEPLTEYRRHLDSLSGAPGPVHLRAVTMIYEKYRPRFASLSERDRAEVERSFRNMFAALARRSAREAMDARDRRAAFDYWMRAQRWSPAWSPILLSRILLPTWAYRGLRSAYNAQD